MTEQELYDPGDRASTIVDPIESAKAAGLRYVNGAGFLQQRLAAL